VRCSGVIPSRGSANDRVTMMPRANVGHIVGGTSFVDDWNPSTHVFGELASFLCAYRIG
jgi:hypothetical protein